MKNLFIIFSAALAISCSSGVSDSKPLSVAADTLISAYSANVVAAKTKYEGKQVLVYGEIASIEDNGSPGALLRTQSNPYAIFAKFPQSEKNTVAGFQRGETKSFLCTVGDVAGNVVNLENCSVN